MRRLTIQPFLWLVPCLLLLYSGCTANTNSAQPAQDGMPAAQSVSSTFTPSTTIVASPVSPLPTATATPVTEPVIITASADALPTLPQDLLFVTEGRLQIWDHQINALRTLWPMAQTLQPRAASHIMPAALGPGEPTGTVKNIVLSADGRKVAAVVYAGFLETGPKDTIVLLDLETGQNTTLVDETGVASGLLFSPDSSWLAYWGEDTLRTAHRPSGLAAPLPQMGGAHTAVPSAIYAQQTTAPYTRLRLGNCPPPTVVNGTDVCNVTLAWTADGSEVMWMSAREIWRADLTGNPASATDAEIVGEPNLWSPHRNYVLGTLGSGHSEGAVRGVLTMAGRKIEIPGTFEYVKRSAELTWTQDEQLLVTRPGNPPLLQRLAIADSDVAVVEEQNIRLSVAMETFPTQPTQLADGRIMFALVNPALQQPASRGLYQWDAGNFTRRNGLPPAYTSNPDDTYFSFSGAIFWSSDGAGAIYIDPYAEGYAAQQVLYVPTDGSALYDLKPILGDSPSTIFWRPNPN